MDFHTRARPPLWESAVRSMKTHLKRIVGNSKLTFEELSTVLAQIESCLNSRPLVALPSDEDAIEALTPGHFLSVVRWKLFPTPLHPTGRSRSSDIGTCARLPLDTSGRDGPPTTYLLSGSSPSGTPHVEMLKSVTSSCCRRMVWSPVSGP